MPPKTKAQIALAATAGSKSGKKKKWSKGKVKDKANNAVMVDQPTYDKIFKEVPTYKMISQSILIERMKINGSVARKAMRTLEAQGLIKKVVQHHGQWVFTRATAAAE
ncbi:40S ribosomal protein S25 [Naganishia onofrii]|uniref:40S ribosomal protein S25 n=2 Tax=Naganishia TaxID=1851509 RepID=A0ACC2W873_9TREE|nr:40S ribosomal protein S25 [Naganishia friedmannii]KAJ9123813.1 40S ribosomal protein S25 [Naganishia onofrii]